MFVSNRWNIAPCDEAGCYGRARVGNGAIRRHATLFLPGDCWPSIRFAQLSRPILAENLKNVFVCILVRISWTAQLMFVFIYVAKNHEYVIVMYHYTRRHQN